MDKRVKLIQRHVITLTFEVTVHAGDAGHRTPSVCQVWSL